MESTTTRLRTWTRTWPPWSACFPQSRSNSRRDCRCRHQPSQLLIRLNHADLLQRIYGRVLAPPAVLTEMRHPDAPVEVRTWAAAPPSWLEEMPVKQLDITLADQLGMGEREAISLAVELRADVLLIDELAGRREAKVRHLNVAGTLAVLLQASLRGYLVFPDELERLRGLQFRSSAAIEGEMLARYRKARMS